MEDSGNKTFDVHLVDDNQEVLAVFTAIVQRLNFSARSFPGPDEYLDYMACAEYFPATLAIITDIEMPKMSGYELIDRVRKVNPSQRFVIMTAGALINDPNNEVSCFYLSKPINHRKLERVTKLLSQCVKTGPFPECYACAPIDDRRNFCIKDWHCPQRENAAGLSQRLAAKRRER